MKVLALLLLTALVSLGCTHQMRMPPDELRFRIGTDASPPSNWFRPSATLDSPPESHISFSWDGPMLSGTRYIALPYRVRQPREGGAWRTGGYGVGVWDLKTGAILCSVNPESPWPEEVSDSAEVAGLFMEDDVLVTQREARLQLWRVSTGQQIGAVVLSNESPFTSLEQTEGGWSASRTSAVRATNVRLQEGGKHIQAWVPHRSRLVMWEVATGRELAAEMRPRADANEAVLACGDKALTRNLVLHSPSHDVPLFPRGTFISQRHETMFSSNCQWLAIRFRYPPYFMDFTPDVTPNHVRIFDTASGELLAWIEGEGTVPLGFVGPRTILLVQDYSGLRLFDLDARTELARRELLSGRVYPIQHDWGLSLLVVGNVAAEVIQVRSPEHHSPRLTDP